ncbi:DinB/UmuC family translesion DNA polymerase, partial [Microbulbifer flavimaris]
QGILTAYDLKSCDLKWIRRRYSVTVERIVRELRGEACLGLTSHESSERQIISSRSFGRSVTDWEQMAQAVSAYVSRAGEKLRQQNKVCQFVSVSIRS